jgi:hypothetical protein
MRWNPPQVLHQREALRHIAGVDDEVEFECELLRKVSIHNDKLVGIRPLDVLDVMLGRDEGVAIGAEGVGEEYDVVALS